MRFLDICAVNFLVWCKLVVKMVRSKWKRINVTQFNVHGSVHRHNFLVCIQQDTILRSLFYLETVLSFGWYHHPSSGAQTTLSTAFGICHAITAPVGGVHHQQHTQTSSNFSTIAADSRNVVTNTKCCRYSCLSSWWWVMVPPEICKAYSR
jgi:hypothetical protein